MKTTKEWLISAGYDIRESFHLDGVINAMEGYSKQVRIDENKKASEVIDFCKGAIDDAIYSEDGLDGLAGEAVLNMIKDWQGLNK